MGFGWLWHPFPDDLTGRNLPEIRQSREAEPSIINEKTISRHDRELFHAVKRESIMSLRTTPDEFWCGCPYRLHGHVSLTCQLILSRIRGQLPWHRSNYLAQN